MTTLGTLSWSERDGEGRVSINGKWRDRHPIVRLDALKDWIALLEAQYEKELDAMNHETPGMRAEWEGKNK